MVAKIDIDAQKFKKKSSTNEAEIGKKLKTASHYSKCTSSKKEQCTSTCSLLKIFETYCCCQH